jgi:hypothetical protein
VRQQGSAERLVFFISNHSVNFIRKKMNEESIGATVLAYTLEKTPSEQDNAGEEICQLLLNHQA